MNKIVIPTGYMGSGSSAITDLISEIDGYDADHGTFEYVFLHCPNGVFDLEDKLLIGNNALRSDEALRVFRKTMKQLYDKKYWWVGHYNINMCPEFMDFTDEYISSLIQYYPSFYWYYQENADMKMIIKLIVRRIVATITFNKIRLPKPLLYNHMVVSYVSPKEFYEKTRKYLSKLWIELGIEKRNLVLDQLLLPFNMYRANNYFGEDEMIAFVVDRDPRDMFIINKYIWAKSGATVPYPTDVDEFCKCYRRLRQMELPATHLGIYRLHFEDLVYHYEKTTIKIYAALGVDERAHKKRFTQFNPDSSIENTQLFLAKKEFNEEARVIASELSEYLYDFPYERIPNFQKCF